MTRQAERSRLVDANRRPSGFGRFRRTVLVVLLCGFLLWLDGTSGPGRAEADTEPGQDKSPAKTAPSVSAPLNSHMGPFVLQSHAFFQLLRLGMNPWMTPSLEPGQLELHASVTWVNLWGWKPARYLVDGEVARVSWTLSSGLTRWLEVRLEVPFTLRTGGLLDKPIEGFHDAFGYVQAGRDAFPRNRFRVVFYQPGGGEVRLDEGDTGLAAGDLTLSARWALYEGTKWLPAVGLSQTLKIPTGQNEGGGVDGAIALYLSKKIWKGYGYFGLQYTRYGQSEILGISMRPDQWSFLSCLEIPVSDRISLLVQDLIQTAAARDFYAFSEPTHELAAGLKFQFHPEALLEFGLIENLFNYDNSPDIGVHFGLSWRFG